MSLFRTDETCVGIRDQSDGGSITKKRLDQRSEGEAFTQCYEEREESKALVEFESDLLHSLTHKHKVRYC